MMKLKKRLLGLLCCCLAFMLCGCSHEDSFAMAREIDDYVNEKCKAAVKNKRSIQVSPGMHNYVGDMNVDTYEVSFKMDNIDYKSIFDVINKMNENIPYSKHTTNGLVYTINDKSYKIYKGDLYEDEVKVYPEPESTVPDSSKIYGTVIEINDVKTTYRYCTFIDYYTNEECILYWHKIDSDRIPENIGYFPYSVGDFIEISNYKSEYVSGIQRYFIEDFDSVRLFDKNNMD